eukprot:scaffold270_cov347-Pavlova_lutheri.AAC.40
MEIGEDDGQGMASRLAQLHIHVDPRWVAEASSFHPGDLERVVDAYLNTDLRVCGRGTLPGPVDAMEVLRGKHVLQVDEAVDVSLPAKERFQAKPKHANRCLKLALTDGKTDLVGFERTLLAWDGTAEDLVGSKILVEDVEVRRGVLVLVNERTIVLGGNSPTMREARDRALGRWNARRTREEMRQGCSVQGRVQEARRAAWEGTGQEAAPGSETRGDAPNGRADENVCQRQAWEHPETRNVGDGAPGSTVDGWNAGLGNNRTAPLAPCEMRPTGNEEQQEGPTDEELEAMRATEAPVQMPPIHAHVENSGPPPGTNTMVPNPTTQLTLNAVSPVGAAGAPMVEEAVEPTSSPSLVMPSPVLSVEQPSAQHLLISPSQTLPGKSDVVPLHLHVRCLKEVLEHNQCCERTDALEKVYVQGVFTHLQMDVSETQYSAVGILEDGTASVEVRFPHTLLEERLFEVSPAQFALVKEEEEIRTKIADNLARFSDFDGIAHIWIQPTNLRAFVIALHEMEGESCKGLARSILGGLAL